MKKFSLERYGRFWWLWFLCILVGIQVASLFDFGHSVVQSLGWIATYLLLAMPGGYFYVKAYKSDIANQIGLKPLRNLLLPWPKSAVLLAVLVLVEFLVVIPFVFVYEGSPCSPLDIARRLNGCVARIPQKDNTLVSKLSFSGDGSTLALVNYGENVTVHVRSYPDMALIQTFEADGVKSVPEVALSSKGDLIALAGYGRAARILETKTGEVRHTLPEDEGGYKHILFTPDDALLVALAEDAVQFWDVAGGELVRSFPYENPDTLAMTPDGQLLASGGLRGKVAVWRLADGTRLHTLDQPFMEAMVFSPDGKYLVTAIWDTHLGINRGYFGDTLLNYWNLETGALERTVLQKNAHIEAIAISRDGAYLAGDTDTHLCSGDRHLLGEVCSHIWQTSTQAPPKPLRIPDGAHSLAFSPVADDLVIGSYEDIYVWRIP